MLQRVTCGTGKTRSDLQLYRLLEALTEGGHSWLSWTPHAWGAHLLPAAGDACAVLHGLHTQERLCPCPSPKLWGCCNGKLSRLRKTLQA